MTLKEYRTTLNKTQQEMADKLGVLQASYARMERRWPRVSYVLLWALVREFGARIWVTGGGFEIEE